MPLRDSIRFEFDVGLFMSLLGLKKFLLELFAPTRGPVGFAAGLYVNPSK